MKYEFKRIDDDTTELRYKDKVFSLRRDVDLQKRIEEAIPRARLKMASDLAKQGMTKKDLVIERHEGNKTFYDNSNIMDAEETYNTLATMEVFDEIIMKYCNMSLTELMQDIGLELEQETEETNQFGVDLMNALTGNSVKTPSPTGKSK